MKLELNIGTTSQFVEVPDACVQQVLLPNAVTYDLTGEDEVRRALAAPIGSPRLGEIVKPGEKIAMPVKAQVESPVRKGQGRHWSRPKIDPQGEQGLPA